MKTVDISPAGAVLADAKYKIPELAKATLNRYANGRFKELKYVTKGFKFQFPFYENVYKKRSFTKIFSILNKTVERLIPYINTSKVKFIDIPREASEIIFIRLGPVNLNTKTDIDKLKASPLLKYLNKINRLIKKNALPLHMTMDFVNYIKPRGRSPYNVYYENTEEQTRNTFSIIEIKVRLITTIAETGYLLLMYAPDILKVLETLHRHAHYADSTYRTPRQN